MKKLLYSICSIILVIALFNFSSAENASAATTIERLGGSDRFEVAVNVSKSEWSTSNTVVITNYAAFADALTATPLAYKNNAPILLTHQDRLTSATRDEIKRLKAVKAIIIGGTGSVSKAVETDLKNAGITTIKRYGGSDRFEVSRNISKEFTSSDKVIVAYGLNFPDALAIAPYAAEEGYPILLSRLTEIPEIIKPAIYNDTVKQAVIIGGPGSVGDSVYKELQSKGKNPLRIGGKDRFEVAANIAERYYSTNKAYIATGFTFADALTGSVLAAKNKAPILLAHPDRSVPVIQNVIFEKSMFNLTILGGPASVPDKTVTSLISYRKAVVNNDGSLNISSTNYSSMDAVPLKNNSEVAVFGDQVVKMQSGMVYASPSLGNSVVEVYNSAGGKITYVAPQTEMKYISADDRRVKVRVADIDGYVLQSEVSMLPWNAVKNRSYYFVSNGNLIHNVRGVNTVIGKSPGFMSSGINYYSWDGYLFYLSNGQAVGTHKQYFQHLPIRSKTSYTADQLLRFINNNTDIEAWEKRYNRQSPLRDKALIDSMIKAQNDYNINALFILAAAIHESAWGVSDIATAKKNLYGIKAYDSNPESAAEGFSSFTASVIAFADEYMSRGYTNPASWKYNGGVAGHKGIGVNTWYASDPNWGSRVAGHMYKIDKFLGGADYNRENLYVTTGAFNVRNAATTSGSTVLYKYPKANIPVVVLGQVTGQSVSGSTVWYKIISEKDGKIGYVHSSGVKKLN